MLLRILKVFNEENSIISAVVFDIGINRNGYDEEKTTITYIYNMMNKRNLYNQHVFVL